ncbi:putative Pyrimidine nucleoside phosphorylase C-terminal domain-containing protein 2 [Homarus americanus]|uniref:Putative Pyrimidine nucleoside phosphorylase C-terminal domain-containing protein 1 n=1 Tax=Homarus americanus TaxID=6706 RepID=A0A8J5JDS3_HOMAM|nr:putative Pyrimidine nucleoside phosphorylase C-terminal domain-containing protein 1 [Homarus americanus]KAG7155120.1 putative Pyrimidine nucleoside phosphorylase C-terminal domain-containing protein 2 [Homarus americanus]
MDAMALAKVSLALGAGRNRVGEPINYAVGIVLHKVVGESVKEGKLGRSCTTTDHYLRLSLPTPRLLSLSTPMPHFEEVSLIAARVV